MDEKQRQIRLPAVIAAIKSLDPENDFTKDGKPETKAISVLTGFDVSADERDAALVDMEKLAKAEEESKSAPAKTAARKILTGEDGLAAMAESRKPVKG
jgi:hypothetical protein